jgi:AraC-like DNA-binding protein
MFVGDYIGTFGPGNLVFTGPGLPHNWISTDVPPEGVPLRDHCVIFNRAPIDQAAALIPELKEIQPLLDRALQGVEFFGISEVVLGYFERMNASQNIARLSVFLELLGVLNQCDNYRLLSNVWVPAADEDDKAVDQINSIVTYITEHYAEPLTMAAVSKRYRMSESHFSRIFRRGTGNNFTDFLIRVRISRACQLLMKSNENIATICYDVGFNNVANFNRRFLDVKGTTPSVFRKEARSNFG